MTFSAKVSELQVQLNQPTKLPEKALRRDVVVYELVCYVNNITGCLLSNHIKPIYIFAERCRWFMSRNIEPKHTAYYALVEEYLDEVEGYLQTLEE